MASRVVRFFKFCSAGLHSGENVASQKRENVASLRLNTLIDNRPRRRRCGLGRMKREAGCLLFASEFDAPVARAAFKRVIGIHRTRRAKAVCGESIRGYVVACDKGLFHRRGTALG